MDMGSSNRVVLDSNFLLLPFQFDIDISSELDRLLDGAYEVCVTKGVIAELEGLSRAKGIQGGRAEEALKMARKLKLIESGGEGVDEDLLQLAGNGAVICTNDKALRERIRNKGSPVIYLRQKKYLALEGYLR